MKIVKVAMCLFSCFCFALNQHLWAEEILTTVEVMVDRIIHNSEQFGITDKDIAEAQRFLNLQYSGYYPKVSLQGSVGADLLRLNEFDRERNSSLNLILDWDLYKNGQLKLSIERAKSSLKIKELNKQQLENEFVFNIKQSLYQLFLYRQNLLLNESRLKVTRQELEQAQIFYKQGNLDRSSVLKSKINLSDLEIRYSQNEDQLKTLQQKLEKQAGAKLQIEEGYIVGLAKEAHDTTVDLAKIIEIALEKQTALLMQKENERVSLLTKKYAKLKRLPEVQLFTGNAFAVDSLGQSNNQLEFRTGVIVRYPLYDGGETTHFIKTAETNYEKAQLEFKKNRDDLIERITNSYYQFMDSKKISDLSSQKFKLILEDVEQSDQELQRGDISRYQWETIQVSYLSARLRNLTLQIDVLLALDELLKNTGLNYLTDYLTIVYGKTIV